MAKTTAMRVQDHDGRKKQAGLVQVKAWIPAELRDRLGALAKAKGLSRDSFISELLDRA